MLWLTNRRVSLRACHAIQNRGQGPRDCPCPPHCGHRRDRDRGHATPRRYLPDSELCS
jgi:hypothetical protein